MNIKRRFRTKPLLWKKMFFLTLFEKNSNLPILLLKITIFGMRRMLGVFNLQLQTKCSQKSMPLRNYQKSLETRFKSNTSFIGWKIGTRFKMEFEPNNFSVIKTSVKIETKLSWSMESLASAKAVSYLSSQKNLTWNVSMCS